MGTRSSKVLKKQPSPKKYMIDGDEWWMDDRGEWQCVHGVGHPGIRRIETLIRGMRRSPASVPSEDRLKEVASIHGCDGCCARESFKKLMVLEGLERMP